MPRNITYDQFIIRKHPKYPDPISSTHLLNRFINSQHKQRLTLTIELVQKRENTQVTHSKHAYILYIPSKYGSLAAKDCDKRITPASNESISFSCRLQSRSLSRDLERVEESRSRLCFCQEAGFRDSGERLLWDLSWRWEDDAAGDCLLADSEIRWNGEISDDYWLKKLHLTCSASIEINYLEFYWLFTIFIID